MLALLRWLNQHKFQTLLMAFLLIILPPIGMFYSAQSTSWTFALLAPVVAGNLLVILIH